MKRKATTNKKKPAVRTKTSEKEVLLTIEKKKKVLGVILIAIAIILFLSIISYNEADENPTTSIINNFVGQAGALISSFFLRNILGYFSIVFPFIIFFWGLAYIIKIDFKKILSYFNIMLIYSVLFATFFGVFRAYRLTYDANYVNSFRLSGDIGNFLGDYSYRYLRLPGSVIVLIVLCVSILIIAFDFKIEKVILGIKNLFIRSKEKIGETLTINSDEDEIVSKNLKNLSKINKGKKDKFDPKESKQEQKPMEKPFLTAEDLQAEEEQETRIRIKRSEAEVKAKDKKDKSEKESGRDKEKEVLDKNEEEYIQEKSDTPRDGNEALPAEDLEHLPDPWEEEIKFNPLGFDLLQPQEAENYKVAEEELTKNAQLLKEKLKLFDIDITDIEVTPGPVVTLYEIVPAPGVKISKIVSLEDDIALALAARGIRIIAPIPGKSAIGVEIPNATSTIVRASSVIPLVRESKAELPIALGKQINGEVYLADLAKMPHMLIAGSTGSGKSVGINMIISSLIYAKHPSEIKFMMIDPKKIELSFYKKLRRHYLAISPDLDEEIVTVPQNAVLLLKSVEIEMEKRYDKLAKAGVRNIIEYNKKIKDVEKRPKDTDKMKHYPLPYLVVIIDELADLMITAGKEVEEPITRLAQLARAVGIHLVVATQRPSVNVITGVIKANFSARIAYQVATKIDSRTILDRNGAEQLLGRGDMLFLPSDQPKPIRLQNAFISTEEVEKITEEIKIQQGYSKPYFLPSMYESKAKEKGQSNFYGDLDPMFEDAAKLIVTSQKGSVSFLQRRLKLGYSRAARIMDQLEEVGIVGPNNGSNARDVIVENNEQLETILRSL